MDRGADDIVLDKAGDIGCEGEGVIECDVWEKKNCGAHP
jgi:hypothetical protein